MQTLERTHDLASVEGTGGPPSRRSKTRWFAVLVGAILVALVAALIGYAAKSPDTKTVIKTVPEPAPKAATPAIDDRGFSKLGNGEQAETNQFQQPMDRTTQLALQHQLELARQAAMQYPTVADAEAAGWHRAGPFAPGLGAHYFKWSEMGTRGLPTGKVDDSAALNPTSLIYDGTKPDSRIAGLMFYSLSNHIPQGFAGVNDIWHYHNDVCIVYGANGTVDTPYGADTTVTKAMCDKYPGSTLVAKTSWMLHAWVVPGYDSPQGVFSHLNEAITCADGTYNTIPLDHIGRRSTVCVDNKE